MAGDILVFVAMGLIVAATLQFWVRPRLLMPVSLFLGGFIVEVVLQFGLLGVSKTVGRAGVAVALLGIAVCVVAFHRRNRRQRQLQGTPDARRLATIAGVGNNPQAVVLSGDGRHAYVPASDGRGTLAVVDLQRRVVSALIRVGRGAADAVPLSPGGRVLVALAGRRLVVVDTASKQVTSIGAAIRSPRGMAASPDGARVYATSMSDSRIWCMDARTLEVIGSAGVGKHPVAVAVSPDGERLYVACSRSGSVAIVNSRSLATVKTVALRADPVKLTTGPGGLVYAMCRDGIVAVIDTVAGRVTESRRPGEHEGGVATMPGADCPWYVTDPWGGTLKAIAPRSTTVCETLAFGSKAPIDVAVGPDNLLCVACQTGVLDLVRLRGTAATQPAQIPPATGGH